MRYTLPLKIEGSPIRQLGLVLAGVAFVVGGVWMIQAGNLKAQIAGWVGVPFFGLATAVGLKQMLNTSPRIVIDHHGVFDRTLGIGIVEWRDLTGVRVGEIRGQHFVCLELRNADAYLDRLPGWRRRLAQVNVDLGFTPFSLNLSGTGADADALAEAIRGELVKRTT